MLGAVSVLFMALGKYGGVYLGWHINKVSTRVKRFLWLCTLPQAGVAIGLVLLVQVSPLVGQLSTGHAKAAGDMVSIVLLSVFVNELLGPPFSKFAVVRGDEMEE